MFEYQITDNSGNVFTLITPNNPLDTFSDVIDVVTVGPYNPSKEWWV